LIVANAEKIGKTRPLVFAKISMTLTLALWPALYNEPFWKVCLLCIIIICMMPILDCDTASVGVIFGLISYISASINSKIFWRFIQSTSVILCLTLPFIFNKVLTDENIFEISKTIQSYSYIHRLHIWQHTSQKIMERPFTGFGIDASVQEDVGGKMISKAYCWQFKENTCLNSTPINTKQIPSHPHNIILQWWLENGLIGIIWLSILIVFIIEKIRELPINTRKITFAFFTTNMMILLVSIGLWQSWWWGTWLFLLPLLTISKKREQLSN